MNELGQTLDLVVRGGRVIDPGRGIDEQLDIGVQFGRIVMLERDLRDWIRSPTSEYPPATSLVVRWLGEAHHRSVRERDVPEQPRKPLPLDRPSFLSVQRRCEPGWSGGSAVFGTFDLCLFA